MSNHAQRTKAALRYAEKELDCYGADKATRDGVIYFMEAVHRVGRCDFRFVCHGDLITLDVYTKTGRVEVLCFHTRLCMMRDRGYVRCMISLAESSIKKGWRR